MSFRIQVGEEAQRIHRESLVLDCHTHFLINGWLLGRKFHREAPKPLFYNPFSNLLDLRSAEKGGIKALAFPARRP